jgi:predicted translin family RNA/ssDNA-binding protein
MKFTLPTKSYQSFEEARRKCLRLSDQLRIESKSAIGFLLKNKKKEADKHLAEAKRINAELQKLLTKIPYLNSVGGVHVGTEEYVEAALLADYVQNKSLSSYEKLKVSHEAYICGICDMTGELLRLGRMKPELMKKILEDITELYQTCLTVVVTRNKGVRHKLEDLERNMKRIEEMIFQYDLKH